MGLPICNRAATCPVTRSREASSVDSDDSAGRRAAQRFEPTPPCTLRSALRHTAQCLRKRYKKQPVLTWDEFSGVPVEARETQTEAGQQQAQQSHAYARVQLTEDDFAHGTLIVFAPCELIFDGSLYSVAPNEADDFRPTAAQRAPGRLYAGDEYALGFFAAIAIRAHDVTLTLNRSTLEQTPLFALQQRFFALIELADQPFVPGQGPANFGSELVPAQNVFISNGILGRSSHHGVHGNGARNVLLQSVDFSDYEVAAVSVNGVHNFVVDQCRALGSRTDVPVGANYSAARFLVPFIDEALALTQGDATLAAERANMESKRDALLLAMADTVAAVQSGVLAPIPDVFKLPNDDGLIDGNGYGFLFNVRGVAVNGFVEQLPTIEQCATNVAIFETQVRETAAAVDQIVALRDTRNGRLLTDTAGAVLPIDAISNEFGEYVGTPLSDAQIALARLVNASAVLQSNALFGGIYVPDEIVLWAEQGTPVFLDAIVDFASNFERMYNGDSMFHVNKGVLGINCNGVYGLTLRKVIVDGVSNLGVAADIGNHPLQGSAAGYTGDDACGVSFASCVYVSASELDVRNVIAEPANGVAMGVNLRGPTASALLAESNVSSVRIGPACADIEICGTEANLTEIEAPLSEVRVTQRC